MKEQEDNIMDNFDLKKYLAEGKLHENVDKVAGGIPYKREGNKFIISEPLDDATKERIISRAKEHGHHAAPNQAGGVTIMAKDKVNEEDEMTPQMKEDEERLEYFKIAQIYGINSTTFGIEWYYKFDDMDGEDKYYHEFNVGEGGTDEDAEYAAYLYTLTNLS